MVHGRAESLLLGSLVLDCVCHILTLEFVQQLEQEEGELDLAAFLFEEILHFSLLNADFNKVLGGDLWSVFVFIGKDVHEVDLGDFKALFIRDHDRADILIGRKLVDHDGQFLFGQGPQIEVEQQVLGRILLGQEGIKEIDLGTRRPVLLSRGK